MVRHRYEAWNRYYGIGKKPKPKPKAKPVAYGPPAPPDRRTIDMLFPSYPDRNEAQWDELLDARVKPFIDTIDRTTLMNRGQAEFQFERAAAANEGLGKAFLGMLTGGKTGAEAEQFSKEQFGGQYLPAQAMSIAADKLRELTNDWNDQDWEISSQYMAAMEKVPGLREQLRADIETQEGNEYERQFKYATLLLDEAWNVYNANAKAFGESEQRKIAEAAIRRQQGLVGYDKRKDAVSEAGRFADDTGTIWTVKRNKDGTWSAVDTGKKKPVKPGQKPSDTKDRNSALTEARDLTKTDTNVWRVRKVNGVWEAYRTNQKKAVAPVKPEDKGKQTAAQKAEADLAMKVQTEFRDQIVGNPAKDDFGTPIPGQFVGGMTYEQAYAWLLRIARSQLTDKTDAYLNNWVQIQLRTYFPQGTTDARGGR
jgi:hypothetical protein